jgi:UDP-N-acetylmuramoyl-L-alanyl-D-glutamate--2,6-diaminopimelate ligase
MKFSKMTELAEEKVIDFESSLDFEVNKLSNNSNDVEPNDIFFAIKGFNSDGNDYINEAFSKGAKAVFTDGEPEINDQRIYKVKDCRKMMAAMSGFFYGYPSRKFKLIGVTGTNGKTTVSSLINFVLQSLGKKTGLIGTNGNFINKRFIKTGFTTPESIELNKLLREMADEEAEFVTMEVSSHSLAMNRVYGLDFDAVIFTNLTPEHLDLHKSMEVYFDAKKSLFDSMKRINEKGNNTTAIYNCDDQYGDKMVSGSPAERIAYGFGCGAYSAKNLKMDFEGMKFDVLVPRNGGETDKIKAETKLTGRFNVYNILASIAALRFFKVEYEEIVKALAEFMPVEGRFNQMKLSSGAIAVIDYSHTPDSLLKAITTIREILDKAGPKKRIITVFGCGGNRDKNKRPVMGEIATQYSDQVIITSDNPRYEEPWTIIEDIKAGIKKDNYFVEENRELAIKKAVEQSKKGDVILIAGKGHEDYQEIKGVKYYFSDRDAAEKYR